MERSTVFSNVPSSYGIMRWRLRFLMYHHYLVNLLTISRSELNQGLDDMNAFELGYTMSFASLQSVVWRMFCKKASCSLQHSWGPAKEMIEAEMVQYTLE